MASITKDMSLARLTDYWWGYIVIAIGQGKGRDMVFTALQSTMKDSYDRGANAVLATQIPSPPEGPSNEPFKKGG